MVAQGDKSWFGWPTDPEMEKMRDAYAKETDPAKAQGAGGGRAGPRARDGAIRLDRPVVRPGAMRANISGWLKAPVPVMWNIEKK